MQFVAHASSLVYLSEVVLPDLPANNRIPALGHMFEELPGFFNGSYSSSDDLL